jgi:hypothetical protein
MKKYIEDEVKLKKFSELDINNLADHYPKEIYKSRYDFINNSFTCGGYMSGKIIHVVATPEAGKSLFLQNEVVNFIEQKKRVAYLTVSDQTELDIVTNFIGIIAQKPLHEVNSNIESYFELYKHKFGDFLGLTIIPSEYTKPINFVDWISNRIDEFDILMVDYEGEFLIDKYNDLFDLFTNWTKKDKLLFVANQPKRSFCDKEILSVNALEGSPHIQHISDVIITIGRDLESFATCGKFNIVKKRLNKELGNIIQPYIRTNEGLFYPCSDAMYVKYKFVKQKDHSVSYEDLKKLDTLEEN